MQAEVRKAGFKLGATVVLRFAAVRRRLGLRIVASETQPWSRQNEEERQWTDCRWDAVGEKGLMSPQIIKQRVFANKARVLITNQPSEDAPL
jgi:hypothetical protein